LRPFAQAGPTRRNQSHAPQLRGGGDACGRVIPHRAARAPTSPNGAPQPLRSRSARMPPDTARPLKVDDPPGTQGQPPRGEKRLGLLPCHESRHGPTCMQSPCAQLRDLVEDERLRYSLGQALSREHESTARPCPVPARPSSCTSAIEIVVAGGGRTPRPAWRLPSVKLPDEQRAQWPGAVQTAKERSVGDGAIRKKPSSSRMRATGPARRAGRLAPSV